MYLAIMCRAWRRIGYGQKIIGRSIGLIDEIRSILCSCPSEIIEERVFPGQFMSVFAVNHL